MENMKEGEVLLEYSNQRSIPMGLEGVPSKEFPLDQENQNLQRTHEQCSHHSPREEWGWLKIVPAQPLPQPKVVQDKALEKKLEVVARQQHCLLKIWKPPLYEDKSK